MAYKLIRFEKEYATTNGRDEALYVALIKKDGQSQPFRVVIEHFDSAPAALKEVARWISAQENDDRRGTEEVAVVERELQADALLEDLNKDLNT